MPSYPGGIYAKVVWFLPLRALLLRGLLTKRSCRVDKQGFHWKSNTSSRSTRDMCETAHIVHRSCPIYNVLLDPEKEQNSQLHLANSCKFDLTHDVLMNYDNCIWFIPFIWWQDQSLSLYHHFTLYLYFTLRPSCAPSVHQTSPPPKNRNQSPRYFHTSLQYLFISFADRVQCVAAFVPLPLYHAA